LGGVTIHGRENMNDGLRIVLRLSCLLALFTGCVSVKVHREALDAIARLGEQVATASGNVRAAGESLAKMDPLATKELYADTKNLRELTLTLKEQVARLSDTAGLIPVSRDDRLRLEITSITGAIRLSVWLDENTSDPIVPGHSYWGSEVTRSSDLLKMNFDVTAEARELCSLGSIKRDPNVCKLKGDLSGVGELVRRRVDSNLANFLRSPFSYELGELRAIDFDVSTWNPGRHYLWIRVRPERHDVHSGKWGIAYRVTSWEIERPKETLRFIGGGNLGSDQAEYVNLPLGEWIDPPQKIPFAIEFPRKKEAQQNVAARETEGTPPNPAAAGGRVPSLRSGPRR
jgi:hypothetical protein